MGLQQDNVQVQMKSLPAAPGAVQSAAAPGDSQRRARPSRCAAQVQPLGQSHPALAHAIRVRRAHGQRVRGGFFGGLRSPRGAGRWAGQLSLLTASGTVIAPFSLTFSFPKIAFRTVDRCGRTANYRCVPSEARKAPAGALAIIPPDASRRTPVLAAAWPNPVATEMPPACI